MASFRGNAILGGAWSRNSPAHLHLLAVDLFYRVRLAVDHPLADYQLAGGKWAGKWNHRYSTDHSLDDELCVAGSAKLSTAFRHLYPSCLD